MLTLPESINSYMPTRTTVNEHDDTLIVRVYMMHKIFLPASEIAATHKQAACNSKPRLPPVLHGNSIVEAIVLFRSPAVSAQILSDLRCPHSAVDPMGVATEPWFSPRAERCLATPHGTVSGGPTDYIQVHLQ